MSVQSLLLLWNPFKAKEVREVQFISSYYIPHIVACTVISCWHKINFKAHFISVQRGRYNFVTAAI